jgi:hypothetical protein
VRNRSTCGFAIPQSPGNTVVVSVRARACSRVRQAEPQRIRRRRGTIGRESLTDRRSARGSYHSRHESPPAPPSHRSTTTQPHNRAVARQAQLGSTAKSVKVASSSAASPVVLLRRSSAGKTCRARPPHVTIRNLLPDSTGIAACLRLSAGASCTKNMKVPHVCGAAGTIHSFAGLQ